MNHSKSKSGLLLMELIISILFFSLSSTLCIQLFVKSHLLKRATVEQNQSLIQSQNLAELYYASDGDYDYILQVLRQDEQIRADAIQTDSNKSSICICFDSDWQTCSPPDMAYQADLTFLGYDADTDLYLAHIMIYHAQKDKTLYELPLQTHVPLRSDRSHE